MDFLECLIAQHGWSRLVVFLLKTEMSIIRPLRVWFHLIVPLVKHSMIVISSKYFSTVISDGVRWQNDHDDPDGPCERPPLSVSNKLVGLRDPDVRLFLRESD